MGFHPILTLIVESLLSKLLLHSYQPYKLGILITQLCRAVQGTPISCVAHLPLLGKKQENQYFQIVKNFFS